MYQKKSAKKWFLEKRVSAHGGTSFFFFCVCVGGGGRERLGEPFNSCLDRTAQRSAGS